MARQARAIRPLVAGNWKMNGLQANVAEALIVRDALDGDLASIGADVLIAPPATLIDRAFCGHREKPLAARWPGLSRRTVGRSYRRYRA